MEKKDLVMNMEFTNSKGDKGKVIKLEDDVFTILWMESKQIYDYPYDEGLLGTMVVIEKKNIEVKNIEEVIKK